MAETFWHSPQWREYERICQVPIARVDELTDATWLTRVIDLSRTEAELWQGVRKSYRALINGARRRFALHTADEIGADVLVPIAQRLHAMCAGRETRPCASWDLMQDWIAQGCGAIVVARRHGPMPDPVAYAYVILWQGWAYYASGASLERSVQHALIWRAMQDLKTRGVRLFELGWLAREGDSEKDRGIARFKQGFGGVDLPANFLLTGAQSSGLQGRSSRPASTNSVVST